MSSACVCHTDERFCLYCEMFVPLERKHELAVKALEHYTDDTQYCGKCDGVTHDPENGQVARDALEEIKRLGEGVLNE